MSNPGTDAAPGEYPAHVKEAVRAGAALHAEHQRSASRLTHVLNAITGWLGQPLAILVFMICTVVWMAANAILPLLGWHAIDTPPFSTMGTVLTVLAVVTTLIILTTQQHESRLSESRAQLTLELAMLGEQKSSKIIEMLDALRRDMPQVATVIDPTVQALSTPTAPQDMLYTLEETRRVVDDELHNGTSDHEREVALE